MVDNKPGSVGSTFSFIYTVHGYFRPRIHWPHKAYPLQNESKKLYVTLSFASAIISMKNVTLMLENQLAAVDLKTNTRSSPQQTWRTEDYFLDQDLVLFTKMQM